METYRNICFLFSRGTRDLIWFWCGTALIFFDLRGKPRERCRRLADVGLIVIERVGGEWRWSRGGRKITSGAEESLNGKIEMRDRCEKLPVAVLAG